MNALPANAQVLIVDDSLTVRMDLEEVLGEVGIEVESAATLAEARRLLESGRHRLLILDIHLPDGDGIEFLEALRESPRHAGLKVMLLSTENEVGERLRGLRTGADEYLGKPYDPGAVCRSVASFLRQAEGAGEAPRHTILLVEDSDTFRHATQEALEAAGYRVLTAPSGEEGLRVALRQRPDAIVIDGVLPGMDGASLVQRMRVHPDLRTTALLLLTGTVGAVGEVEGLSLGADAYLSKGDNFDLLLARLSALLRSSARGAAQSAAPVHAKRVLAVDDSPTFLNTLADELRTDGYDVATAESGEAALRYLETEQVDAILLDLNMPGMSGLEVCRRIREDVGTRDTPVLILTGTQEHDSVIAGLNAGADDYIVKAADLDLLRSRLSAQLRRRQFEDEVRRSERERHQQVFELARHKAAQQLAEARAVLLADLEQKNRELEAARSQAEEASRFKSDFLAAMSHEIRTPMNAILGFTDLLFDDETDPGRRDMLRIVRSASMTLLNLINDILDFSKIEAGKLQLSPAPFAPAELFQRAAELFALKAQEKHLELSVVVEKGVPEHLVADDQRLFQVITNLVSNALKFTEQGQVTLRARYEEGELVVEVRDSGIGISEEQQKRLFAPFEQADRSTTRRYGGTGLGLAICRNLADLMGGRISAQSQLGEGSTFELRVPVGIPDAAAISELRAARVRAPRGRLAVLGGDIGLRAARVASLREAGFHAEAFDLRPAFAADLEAAAVDLLLIEGRDCAEVEARLVGAAAWLVQLPRLLLHSVDGERTHTLPFLPLDAASGPLQAARVLLGLCAGERPLRAMVIHAGGEWLSVLGDALGGFAVDLVGVEALPDGAPALLPDVLMFAPGVSGSALGAALAQPWTDSDPGPLLMATPEDVTSACAAYPVIRDDGEAWLDRERMARPLRQRARRDARGEALIRQWRDAQPMPELAQLVGNGISRLLVAVDEIVDLAARGEDAAALHRAAHSLKGWAGTLRMDQIYEPAVAIDTLASTEAPDRAALHREVLRLCAVSDLISRRYLGGVVASAGQPVGAAKLEVLVVEDNPMNQQYMEKLLARHLIRCDIAGNGREALDRLAVTRYDVILLDMEMPVMDGRETIRAIRADPALAGHHVIALTAHAIDGAARKFIEAGCDDYLAKPVDADLLLAKLRARMPVP
ncbi:response regulator [Pseudomarimonas salicorniae]|uniref:histidine kinase n=1 Tax=Pseudomarimonas salicorniae TaxID=2933270 RepID=A0ABT0GFP6_9GAMM|nr:response regulator [Lysobacter sp. CAU 1642]MCK7593358.1 response regulator [Lysobacter sp. CAU 1642]